jgi:hypothetical protein
MGERGSITPAARSPSRGASADGTDSQELASGASPDGRDSAGRCGAHRGDRLGLAILQRIGAAEAADVPAELDALPGAPDPPFASR